MGEADNFGRRFSFRLTRHFSATSLVGVLVILVALLLFYLHLAFEALKTQKSRANVALTNAFCNTIWPKYASFVLGASAIPRAELAQRDEIRRLKEDVMAQMRGLHVVKVKTYNVDGLTVFSSDPRQIGEDKSTNAGFLTAKAGGIASDITFRNRFDAFEQVIVDRNLVSSYVPIFKSAGAGIEGVFEVYSDVTELVAALERTQWQITGGVLVSFALLYAFLLVIVHRVDRLIKEERRIHEAELIFQAYHDSLTGLPNRAKLVEHLDTLIRDRRTGGVRFALLFLDLDRFKEVNDSLGHLVGDRLLEEVARRVKACLREVDLVARLGGDEFLIALPGLAAAEHVVNVADKVRGAVSGKPYVIDEHHLTVTTSIGVSLYPDDGPDVTSLVKNADTALYHAKRAGRDNTQFFSAGMNARALDTLIMSSDLRLALQRNEFLLHYQPVVELATGRVSAVEALLRWQHPGRGLVSPLQFIPLAEDIGLIEPIGEWALATACEQMRAWQRSGAAPDRVTVNLSARQLRQDDLAQRISDILGQTGLAPHCLELEITESMVMQDAEGAARILHELHRRGVSIAIDDFGTGYSSLSYRRRFPIGVLKIDRSFVKDVPGDPDDSAITRAIIALARVLKRGVIAEGVETHEQLAFLAEMGCEEVQGFLISRPRTAAELEPLLQEPTLLPVGAAA
jgi:diguanylate cyclase (GGDEF)-like protein